MIDFRLYPIIPADHEDPVALARAVAHGGARVMQLRDKSGDARHTLQLARALLQVCGEFGADLIVNDRLDIALAAQAHGVHLGPKDLPVAAARRIAPASLIIGASAGTVDLACRQAAAGADYLGFGAIFDASGSKPEASHHRGVQALREVVNAVPIPVVGIGGIELTNVPQVAQSGAAGVAVIRAIASAADPREQTEAFLDAWDRASLQDG